MTINYWDLTSNFFYNIVANDYVESLFQSRANLVPIEYTKNLYCIMQENNINQIDSSVFIINEFVELNHLLLAIFLAFLLFFIGIINICLNINNLLISLLNIELIFLSLSVLFCCFSLLLGGDPKGQIYALLILSTAAAESAIGLGLLIALYRLCGSIAITNINKLVG